MIRSMLLPAIIVLAMPFSVCFGEDMSVLVQDSFEQGDQTPDGWTSGANLPGVKYVYDKKRSKTGKRSLSLQKSANRFFPIAQWSRTFDYASESQSLKVTTQVRAQKAAKAIVDVQFLDAADNMISHKWASYIGAKEASDRPASHDWKEYAGSVDIPANTKRIAIALQIYGPGKVWFDDLEAEYVNSPAEQTAKKKEHREFTVRIGDAVGSYLAAGVKKKLPSSQPKGLLIVLPGGDGSADFHPFVRKIRDHAVGDDMMVAQPLAKQWTNDQRIVWPTAANKSAEIQFTTEELIGAIVSDVASKTSIDRQRVYLLAWSSGGPAAWATLLQKQSPVVGGIIAMSVFKPDRLPDVSNGKDRSFYILHSPDDRVCPFRMAKQGYEAISAAGAPSKLVEYPGGHGWKGDVFGNISAGIKWLEAKDNTNKAP